MAVARLARFQHEFCFRRPCLVCGSGGSACLQMSDSGHLERDPELQPHTQLSRSKVMHRIRWVQAVQPKVFIHRIDTASVQLSHRRRPILIRETVLSRVLVAGRLGIRLRIVQHAREQCVGVEQERRGVGIPARQVCRGALDPGIEVGDIGPFERGSVCTLGRG